MIEMNDERSDRFRQKNNSRRTAFELSLTIPLLIKVCGSQHSIEEESRANRKAKKDRSISSRLTKAWPSETWFAKVANWDLTNLQVRPWRTALSKGSNSSTRKSMIQLRGSCLMTSLMLEGVGSWRNGKLRVSELLGVWWLVLALLKVGADWETLENVGWVWEELEVEA